MKTKTENRAAIIRDATALDLGRMVKLVERLIQHEKGLGEKNIIDDIEKRQNVLTEYLSDALFNFDNKILLVEKSGRILGIFILEIIERPPFHKHRRVCNIWVGYSKKSPVYIKRLFSMFESWAKEKDCDAISAGIITQNDRTRRLMKVLGYTETYTSFEKGVTL